MSAKKYDMLIKNGSVVMESDVVKLDIVIKDGKIAGLLTNADSEDFEQIIDAEGLLVLPGLVDSHVHFNEPGNEEWEGFTTGSRSAAAGGITTIIDMPLNSIPCTLTKEALKVKIEAGEKNSIVDFALWGGATPDNFDNLEELNSGSVAAFKSFLCNSGLDEFKGINDGELIELLVRMKEMGSMLGVHAENESMVHFLTEKLKRDGRLDRKAFLESRPPEVEEEAVNRALFLKKNISGAGRLHFLHTSLASNIEAINQAKLINSDITVETCPHYLSLSDNDFISIGPYAKCAPALRNTEEIEKMWECVKNGMIDVIGSDHSPSKIEDKDKGNSNIWKAWGGISGIQTMLSTIFTEGTKKRGISLPLLISMMTSAPAKLFGLYPDKGVIQLHSDADIVLMDPGKKWVVTKENLHSRNKHSPFLGKELYGVVTMTILRGKIIYRNGEFDQQPGYGKFIACRRMNNENPGY